MGQTGTGTLSGPPGTERRTTKGGGIPKDAGGGGGVGTRDHRSYEAVSDLDPPPRRKPPRSSPPLETKPPSREDRNPLVIAATSCKERTLPLHRSRNPKGLPASRSHTHAHLQPPSNPTQTSTTPALPRFIPSSHAQAHHPINRMAQGTKTPPPLEPSQSSLRPPFHWPGSKCWQKSPPESRVVNDSLEPRPHGE